MRLLLLAVALVSLGIQQRDLPDSRQPTYNPAVKFYILDQRVSDDVRLCVMMNARDHVYACTDAKDIRALYRTKHVR